MATTTVRRDRLRAMIDTIGESPGAFRRRLLLEGQLSSSPAGRRRRLT